MEPLVSVFYQDHASQVHDKELFIFEQMMNSFTAHEQDEEKILEEYRDIVEGHDNPLVRFLLQMIVSDEEKHQAVVHAITSTLSSDFAGLRAGEELPRLGLISDEEKEGLLALTAKFIHTEEDGIKEYKALLKHSGNYYGGLLVLLIQTIIHDSEKHLMILRFIDKKLRKI